MPVRIYDISKKLGLENKAVLAKAKELGIAGARVASSSLDKITAEYLEQQIRQEHPNLVSPSTSPSILAPASTSHSISIIGAPPETEPMQAQESATATALLEEPPPAESPSALQQAEPSVAEPPISAPPSAEEPESAAET